MNAEKETDVHEERERQNSKQDLGPCGPFPSREAFSPYKRDQLQYPDTLVFTLLNQIQGLKNRSITYCEGTSWENIPGFSSECLEDLFGLTVGHWLTTLMGTLMWDLLQWMTHPDLLPGHRAGGMTSTKTSQH